MELLIPFCHTANTVNFGRLPGRFHGFGGRLGLDRQTKCDTVAGGHSCVFFHFEKGTN